MVTVDELFRLGRSVEATNSIGASQFALFCRALAESIQREERTRTKKYSTQDEVNKIVSARLKEDRAKRGK